MGILEKIEGVVEQAVTNVVNNKIASLLHDVDYRIKTMVEVAGRQVGLDGKYSSVDMNLAWHMIDGFSFANNSPTAGKIAWTGCNIVYKGTNHAITNGNTDKKYVCWILSSPTIFTVGDVKPELTLDDVLVAINDSGTTRLQIVPGKMVHGSAITSGSVNSAELSSGAVVADKIAALAVVEGKIADGAVTSGKIGTNAVTNTKIVDGAVGGSKIGAGSIAEDKLNIAMHMLF